MAWQDGMKVDPVALASYGCYSETYGQAQQKNLCNLYASLGYIEDAPNVGFNIVVLVNYYFKRSKE